MHTYVIALDQSSIPRADWFACFGCFEVKGFHLLHIDNLFNIFMVFKTRIILHILF